jgi:DNA-binding transcriptional LysR family regulator
MKLRDLDLNLLLVFESILRTGSVTLAAEEVGLTQPSMSNALTRLREHLGDQLFVRARGGMQPTVLAQALAPPVTHALAELRAAIEGERRFDPLSSERDFRICMTEVAQRVFLPKLMSCLQAEAPRVRITTVDLHPDATQIALASGDLDLAVGYFENVPNDFYSQRIFQETYVAMLRTGHSAIRGGVLDVDSYLRAAHIVYLPAAASHHTLEAVLDRQFAKLGTKRKIGLRAAHSMGLSSIVAATDLVLTIPSRLGQAFAHLVDVQLCPVPLSLPPIEIKQYWHSRTHKDAGNQWLRSQFKRHFHRLDH